MKRFIPWEPLQTGDIVDVVAPGFAITDEKLQAALKFLENLGLKPRIPRDLFGPDVICSQKDDVRFRHLRSALYAKDSKAIWCLRGGYGSIRLIESVAKLKRPTKNKLFIGYSDATTLHNYLNQFWGFSTVHGPLLDRLGQNSLPWEQVNKMTQLIFGRHENVAFRNLRPLNSAAKRNSKIRAPVVGGNLAVTQTHLGTKFSRPAKSQILFFEDIGERGYKVDKMLKHLEMAGYFKGVKGIVFGEFVGGEESNGETFVPRVIERFAAEQKFPVFSGLSAGHGDQQWPVPLGTAAELDCRKGELTIASGAQLSSKLRRKK